jgi:hypothetical protein
MPIHTVSGMQADSVAGMIRTANASAVQVDRGIGTVARAQALDMCLVRSASHQGGALVLVGNPWAYVFAFSHIAKVVSYGPYSIRYCLLCI